MIGAWLVRHFHAPIMHGTYGTTGEYGWVAMERLWFPDVTTNRISVFMV